MPKHVLHRSSFPRGCPQARMLLWSFILILSFVYRLLGGVSEKQKCQLPFLALRSWNLNKVIDSKLRVTLSIFACRKTTDDSYCGGHENNTNKNPVLLITSGHGLCGHNRLKTSSSITTVAIQGGLRVLQRYVIRVLNCGSQLHLRL